MALIIITLILAIVIVNFLQKLLMSILGANVMFFKPTTKIICYLFVWMLLISAFVA